MLPVSSRPSDLPPAPLVLRKEDLAEEWHFDEVALSQKIQALKEEGDTYLEREKATRAFIDQTKKDCERSCEEVLQKASDNDRADAKDVSRLRTEVLNLQDDQEQIETSTAEEIADIDRRIVAEAARREALRRDLALARGEVPGYQARVEEIEASEVKVLQELDKSLTDKRAQIQAEVYRINRASHEQVLEIEKRLEQDLLAVHEEIASAWKKEYNSIEDALGQRQVLYQEAGCNQDSVDREVRTKLDETHTAMMNHRADFLKQVSSTAKTDFAREAALRETLELAYVGERCAAEEAHRAAHYELKNHERVGQMVSALGSKFHRSTQYSFNLDSRARTTLKASARSILNSPGSTSSD
mmetsp:Transcript_2178/g.4621  ORF Transcript_2178/g.4621 Transcript_2178/m.4621 type:complete len:357 (-) Transcript_2178:22-1092(-)